MVHISEISSGFVKEVSEHLKMNQVIKAVVIAVNDDGKLALSIKQLPENSDNAAEKKYDKTGRTDKNNKNNKIDKTDKGEKSEKSGEIFENPEEFFNHGRRSKNTGNFEDMMNKFKYDSDEKISDLKKSLNPKKTRRRPNQNPNGTK